jgi:hypothetical protein
MSDTLERVQPVQVPKGNHDLAGLVLDGVAKIPTVVVQLRDLVTG